MALGQGLAGVARIAFETTGINETIRDTDRVERSYVSSTKEMSDSAIRLQLAEDRLRRSVERGPSAWREQARAELAVRSARRGLAAETNALTAATARSDAAATGLRGRAASLTGGLAGLSRGVGTLSVGMIGAGGLTAAFFSSVNAASSMEEQLSKTRQVFGDSSRDVEDFSTRTSRSLGIARVQALDTASSFGALLKPLGIVGDESARIAIELTERGADLASFYNTDVVSALDAVRSGVIGEAEPLRRYGALLSEARVQAQALADTGKQSASALTDQEKALARVQLILADTAQAQGDAARTGSNYAGQMRRLNAQLRDLQTSAGTLALPVMTDLVSLLNDGTVAASNFAGALRRLGRVEIPGTSSGLGSWATTIFKNVGPYSFIERAKQLRGLVGGDDEEPGAPGAAGPGLGIGRHRQDGLDVRDEDSAPRRRRRRGRTLADIELDLARAEARDDEAGERRARREQIARIERQVASLERRKNLTNDEKSKLRALYGELAAAQAGLDAMIDEEEQRLADQRARAREARERKAEARRRREEERKRRFEERMRRIDESAARAAERRGDLLDGTGGSRRNMRKRALEHVEKQKKENREAEIDLEQADREQNRWLREFERRQAGRAGHLSMTINDLLHPSYQRRWAASRGRGETFTQEQVQRSQFDFMTEFRGLVDQLGGNLTAAAAGDPRMYGELKSMNATLRDLASNARNSGTRSAKNEIDAAFEGATF